MSHRLSSKTIAASLIGSLLLLVAFGIWRVDSRFVFKRWFGEYRFGIEYGSEFDIDGVEHRLLNSSFYDTPALMYGVHPFRIPTDETPEFRMVSVPAASLHCVYDTLGWGYLAMIDTNTNTFFCSEGEPLLGAVGLEWQRRFEILRKRFPELPYHGGNDRSDKQQGDFAK